MENDQGWFSWVAEPVVQADGSVHLHRYERAFCKAINQKVVDQIVEYLDRWPDAFFGNWITKEPRGRVGKK
jgi:hypothetical protein